MDIYFLEEYAKLYEEVENGTVEIFTYEDDLGKVRHLFIKRVIEMKIDGQLYYDITTPYGYGGPLIEFKEKSIDSKKEFIKRFSKRFDSYCKNNKIVSEFIRFHPLMNNHNFLANVYELELIRETVITEFLPTNNFNNIFSKSARKTTRRLLRNNFEYEIIENVKLSDLNRFSSIYYDTMERNQASDYYYFSNQYFNDLYTYLKDYIVIFNVTFNNVVVASAIYFEYNGLMHAHLSGTIKDYLHKSPAYVIKYAAFEYAEKKGISMLHHGGGTTNSAKDPLLLFKKRFGNTAGNFFVGRKVYDRSIYNKLVRKSDLKLDSTEAQNYFPLYRLKVKG